MHGYPPHWLPKLIIFSSISCFQAEQSYVLTTFSISPHSNIKAQHSETFASQHGSPLIYSPMAIRPPMSSMIPAMESTEVVVRSSFKAKRSHKQFSTNICASRVHTWLCWCPKKVRIYHCQNQLLYSITIYAIPNKLLLCRNLAGCRYSSSE